MKKILFLTLFGLFTLILSWCGYKTRDEVIKYFNDNYDDFENIRNYLSWDIYFTCSNTCDMVDNKWEHIYIYNVASYWRLSEDFREMPLEYRNYIEPLKSLFTWEMRWIDINKKYLSVWLNKSAFSVLYIEPQEVENYDKCSDDEKYFWNITWNRYYDFFDYDFCIEYKDWSFL